MDLVLALCLYREDRVQWCTCDTTAYVGESGSLQEMAVLGQSSLFAFGADKHVEGLKVSGRWPRLVLV